MTRSVLGILGPVARLEGVRSSVALEAVPFAAASSSGGGRFGRRADRCLQAEFSRPRQFLDLGFRRVEETYCGLAHNEFVTVAKAPFSHGGRADAKVRVRGGSHDVAVHVRLDFEQPPGRRVRDRKVRYAFGSQRQSGRGFGQPERVVTGLAYDDQVRRLERICFKRRSNDAPGQ